MRRPTKIAGSAAGNSSFLSRVQRLARRSEKRSWRPAGALRRPNSVFVIIGKIEIRTHTSTRLRKSKPHQNPISGTIARIGTVCSTTAHGNSERSTQRACAIATAVPMPSTQAITRPTAATFAVE